MLDIYVPFFTLSFYRDKLIVRGTVFYKDTFLVYLKYLDRQT